MSAVRGLTRGLYMSACRAVRQLVCAYSVFLMQGMDALAIKNPFPRDASIVLDETNGRHVYMVDGEPILLSVTGVVESVYPVFDDEKVLAKMRASGSIERSPQYRGLTDAQISRKWRAGAEKASRFIPNKSCFPAGNSVFCV